MTWKFSSNIAPQGHIGAAAHRSVRTAAAVAALLLLAAAFPHGEAHSAPNPLRNGDASLLGVVDSVHASIVTVICYPPESAAHVGGKRKRLIGTAIATGDHRIVTTASVAVPGSVVHVLLGGGVERPAVLIGVDRHSNIALFSVEGATLRGLRPAPPQSLAVGTWVAVVSNVAITRPQAALGRIVGRGQRVDYGHAGEVLEIDAPSYPGSTGGAVMNDEGDWVAVVVGRAGTAPASASSRVGAMEPEGEASPGDVLIALSVDEVGWISKELETYGSVRRGYLGIRLRRTSAPSESLGVPVSGVIPGSPADSAGIRAGDRILAVDGQEVHGSDEVTAVVQSMRPGDVAELTVLRETEISPVRVTLGATFPQPPVGPRAMSSSEAEQLKLELKRLEQEKAQLEARLRALQSTTPKQ